MAMKTQIVGSSEVVGANRRARRALASRRGQKGLTLIETAAALGIVALMLASFGRLTAENQGATKSRATAIQASQITAAAGQYIQANFSRVLAATGPDGNATVVVPIARAPGSSSDPNWGTTVPTGGNLESLQKQGFLSQSFTDRNPYGQQSVLVITQPSGTDPATGAPTKTGRLEAMVMTYGGQAIPDSELGRIATSIGASGGFVPTTPPTGTPAGTITGAYGGWRTPATNWNNPVSGTPQPGHIASTLAFQSGVGESDYLNRNNTGVPEDNTMHTAILMNNNDISGANNVTANGTVQGGVVRATTEVNTPAVRGTVGGSMVIDMNQNSVTNVKTISGVLQDIGNGTQDVFTKFNDGVQVNGAIAANGGIVGRGDVALTTGNFVTDDGSVWAKKFYDRDSSNFSLKPGQLSTLDTVNPTLINADTHVYGGSVDRLPKRANGTEIPNPKLHVSCQPSDTVCIQDLENNITEYYNAIALMNTDPTKTMRLGDMLPTMVQRGIFVIGSDGTVTDGQPDPAAPNQPHLIDWRDKNGNPIAVPMKVPMTVTLPTGATQTLTAGVILPPTCGPGGKPEVYLSKLDDSYSFDLIKNEEGNPVITVQRAAGGDGSSVPGSVSGDGIVSQGWVAAGSVFQRAQTITTQPAVRDVAIGAGINLSAEAYVQPVKDGSGNVAQWMVGVSGTGQREKGPNGSGRTVLRRVLAQTFCNFNAQRGFYASSSTFQADAPPD
jgi:type II secretory pathway pseudopilin PulG